MIIVTFTKLFVINIVASRRSLSDNKSLILESDGCLRSAIVFKSAGESEKKAISEAEAKQVKEGQPKQWLQWMAR